VTISLVLETNNLHSDPNKVTASLEELLVHLRGQTLPLASLAELVVTHEGLGAADKERLARAAGRPIVFVELAPGAGYYDAKNRGFEATTADVVAFGDADCFPDDVWLERLTAPFDEGPDVRAVAGRTTYRGDLFGTAATTIDFMYWDSPLGEGCTRNFYANNVAFRRRTFEEARYDVGAEFYRGDCQVLGLRLQEMGVPVRFEAAARTTHRFPDSLKELARLRLLRGADAVALTPHLGRAYLPPGFARLPGLEALVLGARLMFSLRAINRQEMPEAHGARWLACAGIVCGISALDAAGACLKRVGLERVVTRGERADRVALAYHENVDQLSSVSPRGQEVRAA
jgi:hypothetical protein